MSLPFNWPGKVYDSNWQMFAGALNVDGTNYTQPQWVNHVNGVPRTIFGAAETAAGVGSSWLGVGVPVTAHGLDVTQAGLRQIWTGEDVPTYTALGLQHTASAVGFSDNASRAIGTFGDAAISLGGTTAGMLTKAGRLSEGAVAMRLNRGNWGWAPNGLSVGSEVTFGSTRLVPLRFRDPRVGYAIETGDLSVATRGRLGIVANPDHHIFPQAHEPWFSARGINIEDFRLTLDRSTHEAIHFGGGPGRGGGWWNSELMSRLFEREAALGRTLTQK